MSRAEKAHENLGAGELLLERGWVNAAASRLYYALFLAGVYALETKRGKKPTDLKADAANWEHGIVASNASLVRGRRSTDRQLYEALRGLREQADYSDDTIEAELVQGRLGAVRNLVEEATR